MNLLITLLVLVLIVALVLWIVSLIPMDAKAKQILYVVTAVILIVFLIGVLLGWPPLVVLRP